ncbi:DUF4383 domain-containing protein [Streptomyces sp. NBC_01795]|uniref:DUF4383 domain-containing protein n=1 Tax=unclassified Streptomyces TaxID=2593676 RepID=UPI003FA356A3
MAVSHPSHTGPSHPRPSHIHPHTGRHSQQRKPPRRQLLNEHMPAHHKLSRIYRVGAGLVGAGLAGFGILGLVDQIGFLDTGGDRVAGLNTNGALSVLSVVVGMLLFYGMVRGGNFASSLNITLGALFVLSGFANLALLDTGFNLLAFGLQNVLFSFVVGLLLLIFGMYGRVGSALPHDNPYWQHRHPDQTERERHASAAARGHELRRKASLYGGEELDGGEDGSEGQRD